MDNQLYEEIFEAGALSPKAWLTSAIRLKHAADVLFDRYLQEGVATGTDSGEVNLTEMSLGHTATLISGFAMENALKAVAIRHSGGLTSGGRLRKWPADGHNQIALASLVNLHLTTDEDDLLASLTAFVRWAGRYPVPKKPADMPLKQISSLFDLPPSAMDQKARDGFDRLFSKMSDLVLAE